MRYFKKLSVLLLTALITVSPVCSYADTLNDAVKTKNEAQDNLKDTNNKIKGIKGKQKALKKKIKKLDEELVDLLTDIDILEEEISEKQIQVSATEKEQEQAQTDMDKQYHAMKLRIKYMYENNVSDRTVIAEKVTENDTISPLLNRNVFFSDIYKYDRNQLDVYERARDKAEAVAVRLKEEKEELAEEENSLSEQKGLLQKKIAREKKNSKNFEKKIKKSKILAKQYKDTIKEQNEIIKEEVERLRAEEEAAAKQSYNADNNPDYDINYESYGSGTGAEIAKFALQFVGNPYVYGGNSLTHGIDCSGFVKAVYAHFGYSLPRTSGEQKYAGRAVSASELQPGDLVCYDGHVALYIGGGKIVHASSPSTGIKVSNSIYYRTVVGFRRII